MSRHKDMQRALHYYRQQTGIKDIDMATVARFAVERLGMTLPKPVNPIERLSREFATAAREETRVDQNTGRPYRANHVFVDENGQRRWLDVDDAAPRGKMQKSLVLRREQMIGDAWQLTNDADHWNAINPTEEPLQPVLDFTDDVAERKAMSESDETAAE